MKRYCNSYFRVDTQRVIENYRKVQEYIGPSTGIIPVVKGNCYGYGIIPMAKLYKNCCGAEIIACSAMQEAVDLRNAGLEGEIVVIGGIPQHLLDGAVEYDLQIPLFEEKTAYRIQELTSSSEPVKVHIKIETGMNRLGIRPGEDLERLLTLIKTLDRIEVVGVYSHFSTSTSDYNDPFALIQCERFRSAVEQIRQAGFKPKYIHCCNSAAIAWFKDAYFTHVRSCTSLLGHVAMEDGREPIGLMEPLEIGAYITNIHHIDTGESIGYSRAFFADRPMDIATISVGFGDGFYPKWFRSQGPVLINGQRTHFLGCCMDQSFADVTGLECEIGDKVILIGSSGDERITTWDMEQFCGNTFEFLYGTIGTRVERIYI
ncbi:MAG: alanine racemase [Eubacteriaceae bacterium]|nr:alanine racemase [Eubacteriaceae bacterium]